MRMATVTKLFRRGILLSIGVVAGLTSVGAARYGSTVTFEVDPVHTSVLFRAKHLGIAYVYGFFTVAEGTIVLDEANPANSSVSLRIAADSIYTRSQQRDDHLKSPDFFDVKQFPSISFKSKSVKPLKGNTYEVTGDITIHGVTRPLTVRVEQTGRGKGMQGEERIGFHTVFTIKRSQFGMTYMLGERGIADDVEITLSVEAIRK